MMGNLPFVSVIILIGLGIYSLLFKKNLIKIAIGLTLIESGVNLFLIALGYRNGAVAPIYTQAPEGVKMALPTPQALCLTSIVIGVATTALILSIVMIIYKKYGTLNTDEIRRLKG